VSALIFIPVNAANYLPSFLSSRPIQNRFNRPVALVHQFHSPPADWNYKLLVVESELPKNRSVRVAVIIRILDRLVAELVCSAMDDSAFYAAAGKSGGVPFGIVIAPCRVLRPEASSKLAAPHDQCGFEHAALFQVADRFVEKPTPRDSTAGKRKPRINSKDCHGQPVESNFPSRE